MQNESTSSIFDLFQQKSCPGDISGHNFYECTIDFHVVFDYLLELLYFNRVTKKSV